MACEVCMILAGSGRPAISAAASAAANRGAARMPCPNCNEPAPGERPRMPVGFVPHDNADNGLVH
jgi:hypothetical protein